MRFSLLFATAACAALIAAADAPAARPTIFVVSAHPDDFEGCVGTMFLLRDKYDIHMMDFTAGEAGLGKAGFDSGEAKRLRYREECEACKYVGAKLYYAGEMNAPACYPEKQAYANRATCEKIAALIRKLKPRAVFTHWPIDHHDDHTMTSMAVMKAIEMSGEDPEVFYFEQGPWEVAQFMPRFYVDISSVVKERETFTRFYRCQGPDEMVGEKLALSTWRGQRDMWPRVPHVELLGVRVPRPVGTPSVLDDLPRAVQPAATSKGADAR